MPASPSPPLPQRTEEKQGAPDTAQDNNPQRANGLTASPPPPRPPIAISLSHPRQPTHASAAPSRPAVVCQHRPPPDASGIDALDAELRLVDRPPAPRRVIRSGGRSQRATEVQGLLPVAALVDGLGDAQGPAPKAVAVTVAVCATAPRQRGGVESARSRSGPDTRNAGSSPTSRERSRRCASFAGPCQRHSVVELLRAQRGWTHLVALGRPRHPRARFLFQRDDVTLDDA